MDPFLNREIGHRYLPREFLGAGAHARVYRAWDAVRSAEVALKIYKEDSLDAQEAEAAANFEVWEGAAVLPLLEVHPEFLEGQTTVMPLAEGTLADHGVVFASQAIDWTRRVLTGLEFCHGRGVVHGDVKPRNVFRTRRRGVLLGDFGVRDFQEGGRRGHTLEYAAPELLRGQPRSSHTDTWSAGVMFYELLTGHLPFGSRAEDPEEVVAERTSGRPLRAAGPGQALSASAPVPRLLQRLFSAGPETATDHAPGSDAPTARRPVDPCGMATDPAPERRGSIRGSCVDRPR